MQANDPQAVADERASLRALQTGDLASARAILRRWARRDPGHLGAWLRLAGVCRKAGDAQEALEALTSALRIDPRNFIALLMLAALKESQGDVRAAAEQYAIAIAQAPADDMLDSPTRAALERGRQLVERHSRELFDFIHSAVTDARLDCTPAERKRLEYFIGTTLRTRKRYVQQPMEFFYPGLPSIEFYERAHFPWIQELEATTDLIREELRVILEEGGVGFTPYVNYADHVPLDQWRELNKSTDWTAWQFYEHGSPIESRWARAPLTCAAFTRLPQPHVLRRSPAAMFSALTPRTRIPPHTGIANFRLVVHLPLVVPAGCGFRVGGEIREWREGEAWVFDDTIEHEAWNDSDQRRIILICDVWSPFLSGAEREAIAAVIAARDTYTGTSPTHSVI